MEVGGNDEVFEITVEDIDAGRRAVVAELRRFWPGCIVEDASEAVIPLLMSDVDVRRLETTPEMFAYENEAARRAWAQGGDPDLTTVMHLIWETEGETKQLTVVWDEKPTPLDRINVKRFLAHVRKILAPFAEPRELATHWSLEAQADVEGRHGLDTEASVVRMMGDAVSKDLQKVAVVRAREWAAAAWYVKAFCLLMVRVGRIVDGIERIARGASIKVRLHQTRREVWAMAEAYATKSVEEILGG